MKKILFVLLLLLVGNAGAQQPWVQSRFDGTPAGNICAGCKTELDKYVHVRFTLEDDPATSSINEAPRIISDGGDTRFEFTLQLRTTFTDDPEGLALQGAQVRLKHSTIGFGESLDSPKILNFLGQPNASAKCSYTQAAVFTEGTGSYAVNAQTFASGTSDLTYTVNSNQAADGGASAFDVFGHITTDFKNLVTINCIVADADSESGIVLDGGNISNIVIRRFGPPPTRTQLDPTGSPNPQRAIFPLAANDLRGFRLDGKTWAEDYARFDDGMGVRLKFSKGVYADNSGTKADLTADNFIVYDSDGATDTISITDVEHTADDAYVKITIDTAAVGALIRLVSTGTSIVRDTDGNDLADGNFVASLEYDADAPRISRMPTRDTSFTTAQQSRWTLDFSSPIRTDTINKDYLCITEPNGVCVAEGATPTVPIVSVTGGSVANPVTDETTTSKVTVVINEGVGKVGGMRSIEFRRNAVLSDELKIVEDYQTELREQIQLTNRIGPRITVTDASMDVDPDNEGNYLKYEVRFTVTADETVPDLAVPASYGLRRFPIDTLIATGFTVNSSAATDLMLDGRPNRQVRLVYNVTFDSASTVRTGPGMVLVRGPNNSLTDGDPMNPLGPTTVNSSNEVINVAEGNQLDLTSATRFAVRPDANRPIITAAAAGDAMVGSGNAKLYSGSFTVTVADASNRVPDIGDPDSYVLLREQNNDTTDSLEVVSTSLSTIDSVSLTAGTVTTKTAVINFSVTLATLDDARATRYFTLGRKGIFANDKLLDIYSNTPARPGNIPIGGDARISTGAASQANRASDNTLLTIAEATAAMPVSGNANQYRMTFSILARNRGGDPRTLTDIGDKTAYTLIHIPTSGQPIDLATDNSITVTSIGATLAGSSADIQYTVTFTDIADTQRTAGFTIGYAGNDKLLASNGDKPIRSADFSAIADGDPIAFVDGGVYDDDDVAARDTTAPYLAITNNPTSTVMTNDNGATYTFNFKVVASEPVQKLLDKGSYRLLVAGEQGDIANNALVDTTIPTTPTAVPGEDNTVNIAYKVALSNIRALSAFSSKAANFVPYGFLLARDNDALRDNSNNDPVKANNAGNAAVTPLATVNNGDLFQDGKVAVLDQDAPVITLTDDTEAVPDDDNRFGEVYDMTFTVEASEDVTQIGDINSYTLMRVKANNSVETAVISGDTGAITVTSSEDSGNPADDAVGDEATFTYTVTFRRNNATDLARIRDTKGFTLALVAGRLQDAANNPPVNAASPAQEIYNDSNVLQRQGIIPPVVIGTSPPDVMAARDTTAPNMGVIPEGNMDAQPNDDDPTIYSGSFTVNSTGLIRDIGTPGAYQLLRIPTPGNGNPVVISDATITKRIGLQDGRVAVLEFSNADVGEIADARVTAGFTLALNTARPDGTRLRDYSNNNAVTDAQNRLDTRAILEKDTTAPVITVRAIDIAGTAVGSTDSDGVFAEPAQTGTAGSRYTMQFRVTASEAVPTLNNTASYNLAGIDISDGTTVTINQSNVTPAANAAGSSRATTLTYTVTGITNPTSLAGFTLIRSGDASLIDKSGNPPSAANSERIDSNTAAIAYRDRTPPRLTVTAQGSSPKAVPSADGMAYAMTFRLVFNEFMKVVVDGINERYSLASIDTSSSATITNLNINASTTQITGDGDQFVLPFNVSGITNPTDIEAFTLVRSGDLMTDYSGNPAVRHDGTEIAVGEVIDDRDAALADRDTAPPQITIIASPAVATVDASGNYTLQFAVNADEDVKDLNLATSYRLIRVDNNNDFTTTAFTPGAPTVIPGTNDRGYVIQYTNVNLTGLSRAQIRGVKGFTLGRLGPLNNNVFIDRSGNSPVKADGTTSISNNPTDDIEDTIIAAISSGAVDSAAISERDSTPPEITVRSSTATVTISGNNITISGTFRVSATENILGIGLGSSYQLKVIRNNDSVDDSPGIVRFDTANTNSDRASIGYTVTYSGSTARDNVRAAKGFTLGRKDAATNSNTLIDYASNIPVDPNNTGNQINSAGERLDSRASAISLIDKSAPSLTVTALTTGDLTGVRDGTNNTYTMQFRINSDKAIDDIGDPAAYTLMRIPSGGGAAVAITTNGTRSSGSLAGTQATITFTGQFTAAEIADEQGTIGFTLGRATDADAGTNCRLCSLASAKPTRGGGSRGTGDIDAGQRIDNTATVNRDNTAPQIVVESDGNLEQLTTADLNNNRSGMQASGAFYLRFKLEGDYSDISDIVDDVIQPGVLTPGALTPGFQSGFRVLRKHSGSDTYSVVNRQDINPGTPALPGVTACRELQGTNIMTIPNCYYIVAPDVLLSATDAANTDYFTLGRAPGGLRDPSNNAPIVANYQTPNTVVRAVGDDAGPLPLNATSSATLLLERNEPSISVSLVRPGDAEPLNFFRIGNQICGSFFVSGADSNGAEPIDGINEAGSYRLLSIASDGTATELTTAGGENESCEGHGSVISSVTPQASADVPFPSLLSARVNFNVVDAAVTTAHKYTLGRKAKLTDISGNALISTPTGVVVTDVADRTSRIDLRDDTALGNIPPGDTTNPIITATVIDNTPGDDVEAEAVTPHPLTFEGSFRVVVQQPEDPDDGEAENVARIGDIGAYRVVYLSIASEQEVAIANSRYTISTSDIEENRAATVSFRARFPDVAAAQDAVGFRLRPVNLTDEGGNRPEGNEFKDTDDGVGDSTLARIEKTSPQITIAALDSRMATADANDNYTMRFTVSANEPVTTLGSGSSYEVIRIKNDNNIAYDANATAGNSQQVVANTQYTISYTANLSALSAAERRNTKGFTLARASTMTLALVDRSGNPPVKAADSTAIGLAAPIAAVTNDGVVATAIAAREKVRPQIEVRPDGGAVPDPDQINAYIATFMVRSVTGEPIKGLGNPINYRAQRVLKDGSLDNTFGFSLNNPNSDFGATQNATIRMRFLFPNDSSRDRAIRNTRGFTLGVGYIGATSVDLTDYASNLPQGVESVGDRIDSSEAAIALRDTQGPQITVIAGNDGNAVADETDPLVYTGSFRVAAPKTLPGLGTFGSYKLLRIDADDNPIDVTTATITVADAKAANASTATLAFTALFDGITQVQDTKGFTLGYAANLVDPISRNFPVQSENGQLDEREAALAARDTTPPKITVRSQGEPAFESGEDSVTYTAVFDVSADERIRNINAPSSYQLWRIGGDASVVESAATIEVTDARAANASTATVTANIVLPNDIVSETSGFTLARGRAVSDLLDMASNAPVDAETGDAVAINTRLDSREAAIAASFRVRVECAPFYPNIGQRELFLRITSDTAVDPNALTLTQEIAGTTMTATLFDNTDTAEHIGGTTGTYAILKVSLGSEITSGEDIRVSYFDAESDRTVPATCNEDDLADLTDSDGDRVNDIVDSNPFDATVETPNRNVAAPIAEISPPPASINVYYSRKVVVRSLLRGESFGYIEEDENGKPQTMTHSGSMTAAEYFGITDGNARLYRDDPMCQSVLNTARDHNLTQVRIDEFCTDVTNDFANEAVTVDGELRSYAWATVRGGRLVASDYERYDVAILPEINFLGQSSYLFADATSKTVVISAYVGDSTEPVRISVKGASRDSDFEETEEVDLRPMPTNPKDEGTILRRYDITSHGEHPQRGETITRWLSAPMGSAIWQPKEETLMPIDGGYSEFSSYMYAIGTHNHINVRVADPVNVSEQITEIRQVLLYEVPVNANDPLTRAKSMVAGRTYYVAVDFDTNIQNIEAEIEVAFQHQRGLYEITETTVTAVPRVRGTGHLEKEEVDIIVIEVAADINTTSVITVGWNKVGSVDNVISRYLVTIDNPVDYALADNDFDGIPDSHNGMDVDNHPAENSFLQVATGQGMEREIDLVRGGFLATQDGNPTFLTYEGIVIADALNNAGEIKDINYSVVNNGDLDDNTRQLLDISTTEGIDTIATFGVAGVEYGFELEGDTVRVTGGVVYASFPLVVVDPELIGEVLYLGKYSSNADRWVRFERGTGGNDDTWYAIDRPDTGACPTDVQVYQNQHQAVGDDGMGFTAGDTGNCIMVVLSDGGSYDSSSLDGRVLDPTGFSKNPFARDSGRRAGGGGGGGAIGVSDILLLIGALVLITVASRKRRRTY